jgi:hypothetical protein
MLICDRNDTSVVSSTCTDTKLADLISFKILEFKTLVTHCIN